MLKATSQNTIKSVVVNNTIDEIVLKCEKYLKGGSKRKA